MLKLKTLWPLGYASFTLVSFLPAICSAVRRYRFEYPTLYLIGNTRGCYNIEEVLSANRREPTGILQKSDTDANTSLKPG